MDNDKKDKVAAAVMLGAAGVSLAYVLTKFKVTEQPPPTSVSTPPSSSSSSSSSTTTSPPTSTGSGSVTFVENGFYQYAQQGYTWSVTINGQTKSGATVVSFTLPYGTYEYTVTPPQGMSASPSSGTVTINSPGTIEIQINFSGSPSSPPPTPTTSCTPLSYSESLSGYECFGTPDTPCENARAIFRIFTDTIEDAPQQSSNGPTLAYDPNYTYPDGVKGAYAWFADGQEFVPTEEYRCDRTAARDAAYLKYMNDHFSEAKLLGLYWWKCYWFLYVLYPGVSYTAVNSELHPAEISSASQIAPGLTFIGPISLISAFAEFATQGAGVSLNGCSSSTVADHTATFKESGLPPGTTWEGPTVEMGSWVSGGNTSTTTEFQIIIPYAETFTAHDVLVPTSSGVVTYRPNPASGTVSPGETIEITYSPG